MTIPLLNDNLLGYLTNLSKRISNLERTVEGNIQYGLGILTWPGGTPESDLLTVPHNLGAGTFISVTPVSRVSGVVVVSWSDIPTSTQFSIRCRTVDGSSPAAAATASVHWILVI